MAAHRYLRAVGLEAYGLDGLELSEFQLLSGGLRVDASASLTSNIVPDISGVLANLQDDVLGTAARWSAAAVNGLVFQWDFGGTPAAVDDIRLAGDNLVRFLLIVKLQWSDDAEEWADARTYSGITWPGAQVKTESSVVETPVPGTVTSVSAGVGGWRDATGRAYTVAGDAGVVTTGGVSALVFDASGDYLSSLTNLSDFAFGAGDFTVEAILSMPAASREMVIADFYSSGATWQVSVSAANKLTFYRNSTSSYPVTGTTSLRDEVVRHVAVCRKDGIMRAFVAGNLESSAADTSDYSSIPAAFAIGAQVASRNAAYDFLGKIYGLRIIKGTALYDADFTPPAELVGITSAGHIPLNAAQGRIFNSRPAILGTGPVMVYGAGRTMPPQRLTIESGAIKDLLTGVLGQGIGRVSGTVELKNTPDNTPLMRRVRLIRERDGLQVRETWSDPVTGIYDFTYIDELQTWTVVSYDYTHDERAVVADGLTLANGGVRLMP